MRLWKSFRVQRRDEISYYDTMGEFEAERFAVNLNQRQWRKNRRPE